MTSVPPLRPALCDWRFLMPAPPAGVFANVAMLGASAGECAFTREAGVAHEVTEDLPADASAEVVVLRSTARVPMHQIAQALARHGVAYIEVDRSLAGSRRRTPRAVASACAQAGLTHASVYALIGTFRAPRAFIPLGGLAPFEWYLDVITRSASPPAVALERALRILVGRGPEALAAFCLRFAVVASRADPEVTRTPILALEAGSGIEPYPSSEVLLMTGGGDRVVALPFSGLRRTPDAVIKLPRLPSLASRTENDHATLRGLRTQIPDGMRESIPLPLGEKRVAGVHAVSESVVPGVTILRTSGRWRAPVERRLDDLRRSAEWLAAFHAATETRRVAWSASGEQLLEEVGGRYLSGFGRRADEEALIADAIGFGRRYGALELPMVMQHRDFNPWNIVRDGDRIGVFDWEGARHGPALVDLLQLCTNWYDAACGALREDAKRAHYLALFLGDPPSKLVSGAREIVAAYLDAMRMRRELTPLLILVSWLDLALNRDAQRRDHGTQAGDPRAGNRAVPFIELLARERTRVFDAAAWRQAGA